MSQADEDMNAFRLQSVLAIHRVIEGFLEGAILVDEQAAIQWISPSYMKFLRIARLEDVVGRPVELILPQSKMRAVVETGKAYPIDLMQYGDDRSLAVTRLPLSDSQGRVIGAFSFAFKDFITHLQPLIDRVTSLQRRLNQAEKALDAQRRPRYGFENIIGVSPQMIQIRRLARRAAKVTSSILILGETGTGKEMIAQAIHSASPRFDKPFVAINMSAIPEGLIEAELFGVAPGAYTGAGREKRPGKFQLADGGTLFLDEIGDLPQPWQAKLLRVLQEREVEPLGSNKLVKVDVHIIAATSRDLAAMVEAGEFREDLYYRLNVLQIQIPPLRERKEDIELLAFNFMERIVHECQLEPFEIAPSALEVLTAYDWPGNVRQLANVIERACIRAEKGVLAAEDFIDILPRRGKAAPQSQESSGRRPLNALVASAEQRAVTDALQRSGGNKAAAAKILGISRTNLYAKMAKHGLG